MNNAATVASHRLAGGLTFCARWPPPTLPIRLACQSFRSCLPRDSRTIRSATRPFTLQLSTQKRCFAQRSTSPFHASPVTNALRPRKNEEPQEKGLAFRSRNLSSTELAPVFGKDSPKPQAANYLLRVLHGRRNDGTLDLPLPADLQTVITKHPAAIEDGLNWLRQNYPIDEDAAIVARLEREEVGQEYSPSELEQRANDIGLYGPQSGRYHARLSDSAREGDVWGQSELEKIRAENEAKAAREEEELKAEIDQKMAEEHLRREAVTQKRLEQQKQATELARDNKALATQSERGLSDDVKALRPPNEYEKWVIRNKKQSTSDLELDSTEVADMSWARRVLPSAFFVTLICIGCYLYSQYWTPPRRSDRRYPDWPLTYATIWGLVACNIFIFMTWRFPPAWKLLNKFFIMVPGYPRVLSMVGNTFSHVTKLHLFNNMACLTIIGSALHEEVGRGTFLGIYIAGGAVGSLACLIWYTARGVLITSSMGASGCVCAIAAALCWLNADQEFTLVFLPEDWKRWSHGIPGWALAGLLLAAEVFGLIFRPLSKIDHMGHLGGLVVGLVSAQWMRNERKASEKRGEAVQELPRFRSAMTDMKDLWYDGYDKGGHRAEERGEVNKEKRNYGGEGDPGR